MNTRDLGYYLEGVERIWGKGFWVDRRREHVTGWGAVLGNHEDHEGKARKQDQGNGDGNGLEEERSATRTSERTGKLYSTYREKRQLQSVNDGAVERELDS